MSETGSARIDRTPEALAVLRDRILSLASLADTRVKPDPHGVIPDGPRKGPVWKPHGKWRIRALEDPDAAGFVYVTTPQDWDGDYEPMSLEEARRLAMSLLAACDWAERGSGEPGRRYRAADDKDRLDGARTFICGTR